MEKRKNIQNGPPRVRYFIEDKFHLANMGAIVMFLSTRKRQQNFDRNMEINYHQKALHATFSEDYQVAKVMR